MGDGLKLLQSVVSVLLNRKLMRLIAVAATLLYSLYQFVAPREMKVFSAAWLFWPMLIGGCGLVGHNVIDLDEWLKGRKYLQHLTNDEKQVLSQFIADDRRAIIAFLHDVKLEGTANSLIEAGLLKATPPPTSPLLPSGTTHSWTIEPWLFKHLKKHPKLLRKS